MLKELKIENYAIIDNLAIDFSAGLNTITGETGAGKSILLGALGLLAGGRAEASAFADNERNCVIEALFETTNETDFLAANDIEHHNGEIIIRRTFTTAGRSRSFVNDQPVPLTILRELSDRLVDIHSQHQTLLLANTEYQTQIVDSISGYAIDRYRGIYQSLRQATKELKTLTEQASANKRRAEFLEFQLTQIAEAQIRPTEITEMEARAKMLGNATEIAQALSLASGVMLGDESGILLGLKSSIQAITKISDSYTKAAEFLERLNPLYLEAKDLAADLESAGENIEINPAELESIQDRLDTIYTLMQKHGVSTPLELLELNDQMQIELDAISDVDTQIEQLSKTIEKLTTDARTEAVKIDKARRNIAPKIEKEITTTLRELGIKEATFQVAITTTTELTPTGTNSISLLFSGNAGKSPQPIESVASGGEMSRVMLSIKGMMSRTTQLPTIIFDEIDTGVSGSVAHKMGEIIYAMSQRMQVLNITHLPQVASKGDNHLLVYKDIAGTHIRKLTVEERVSHIADMLSGEAVTDAARTQAMELINGNK